MKQRGTTIIEVLVYLALFGIVMGGVVVTSFHIYESSHKTHAVIAIVDESEFIKSKINWILSESNFVHSPQKNTSSPVLSVQSLRTDYANPVRIFVSDQALLIQYGISTAIPISKSTIKISDLSFDYAEDAVLSQLFIKMKYTLSAHTTNGMQIIQEFEHLFYMYE